MKIEKINENQIRCTLNKSDMEEYHLKLSELAYGTEKAKALFRDMMTKANYEFGFAAEDLPLMIEAIPLSAECIVLVITKVDCPEELDTRFSRFTPAPEEEDADKDVNVVDFLESASDVLDLFEKISRPGKEDKKEQTPEEKKKASAKDNPGFVPLSDALENIAKAKQKIKEIKETIAETPVAPAGEIDLTKLYMFDDLEGVSRIAKVLEGFYTGRNTLYKDVNDGMYYLFLAKSDLSPEDFNKTCNIFSEYAKQSTYTPAVQAYFEEHCETIIKDRALQVMATI